MWSFFLVGGWTNPSEKYESHSIISLRRGRNQKHWKPPPGFGLSTALETFPRLEELQIFFHASIAEGRIYLGGLLKSWEIYQCFLGPLKRSSHNLPATLWLARMSLCLWGNASSKDPFSIAMLDYRGVQRNGGWLGHKVFFWAISITWGVLKLGIAWVAPPFTNHEQAI